MIEVRLFATFREGRQKICFFPAEEYPTCHDILAALGIPDEEVAICLLNGRHNKTSVPVKDGDVLALFPPVGGG